MTSTSPVSIVGYPAAALAIVVGLLLMIVLPLAIAIPVGLIVGAIAAVVVRRSALSIALHELGASPAGEDGHERVDNLLEGLCLSSGSAMPRLHITRHRAPDAAVVGRAADDADLVVTAGAVEDLSRLELEALIARALCLLDNDIETATLLCAAGRLLGRGSLAGKYISRHLVPEAVVLADFAGVRLTRYPPALADAMTRSQEAGGVPSHPTTDHLWLFGPLSIDNSVRPPLDQRIDTLQEL